MISWGFDTLSYVRFDGMAWSVIDRGQIVGAGFEIRSRSDVVLAFSRRLAV